MHTGYKTDSLLIKTYFLKNYASNWLLAITIKIINNSLLSMKQENCHKHNNNLLSEFFH